MSVNRTPCRVAIEMGGAGAKVELAVETTEPLDPGAVALVMADMATLVQTVRRHTPAPGLVPRPAPAAHAVDRLRDAFDHGGRS